MLDNMINIKVAGNLKNNSLREDDFNENANKETSNDLCDVVSSDNFNAKIENLVNGANENEVKKLNCDDDNSGSESKFHSVKPIDGENVLTQVFKEKRPFDFSPVACTSYPHFTFVEISKDGCLLLGTSDLMGQYWTGNVWFFKNAENESALTAIECSNSIICGLFLNNNGELLAVGEHTGKILMLQLTIIGKNYYLDTLFSNDYNEYENFMHSNSVTSLTSSCDYSTIVSSSLDCSLGIWDVKEACNKSYYKNAQARSIMCVKVNKFKDFPIFASCGLDGKAVLWDYRLPSPAKIIFKDEKNSLMSLDWKNENEIALGSINGIVKLYDIRYLNKELNETNFGFCLKKLTFDDNGNMAVCGSSQIIHVWNWSSGSISLANQQHTNYVSGISWNPQNGKLYSCGLDSLIVSHELKY